MALPGPAPKPNKIGRTPNADWTDVPNVPHVAGRARDLPVRRVRRVDDQGKTQDDVIAWDPQTVRWWEVVREMPHASLWTEPDWLFAEDTAYLKDAFYRGGANGGEMVEMRRREDLMGLSAESRRSFRIRYTAPPAEADEPEPETPAGVIPISRTSSRRRGRVLED